MEIIVWQQGMQMIISFFFSGTSKKEGGVWSREGDAYRTPLDLCRSPSLSFYNTLFLSCRHTPAGPSSPCVMYEMRPLLTCGQTHKASFSTGSFVTSKHSKQATQSSRISKAPCCQIGSDPKPPKSSQLTNT